MKVTDSSIPLHLIDFWKNQNEKLLSNPCFLKEEGTLFDDVLCFMNNKNYVTRIDFSLFDLPHIKIDGAANINIDGQCYSLSAKDYAKLFILACIPATNTNHLLGAYQVVVHIFAFLNRNHSLVLSSSNVEDFFGSILVESVNELGFYNRISPPSYSGVVKPSSPPKVRNKLQALGVVGVIDNRLTLIKVEKSLDAVCRSQLGFTLNEYKQGGSYNFLGLELGQYYVDYLRQVYQKDYLYMLVYKKTINKMIKKYDFSSFCSKSSNRINSVMLSAFIGIDLNKNRHNTKGINHENLQIDIHKTAYTFYKKHFEEAMSLNDECIEELVLKLGLGMRFDAVEVIRILMLQKFHGLEGHKTKEEVWGGYLASLDKTFIDSNKLVVMTVDDVYAQMKLIVNAKKLRKIVFLNNVKNWGASLLKNCFKTDFNSFKAELNTIAHAMTNLVVAWLGYRKSEFGFPLNAIHIEANTDILDNSHVPFRFKLKWLVPKTNGKTKIDREITSQCYQISAQLNDLFDAQEDSPCLYDYATKNFQAHNVSGRMIESRIKASWRGFVLNYQPFNDALLLNDLMRKNIEVLSSLDEYEIERLGNTYDTRSARYKHLLSTAQEVKQDLKRLNCISFNGSKAQAKFKKSLECYVKTSEIQNPHHKELVDTYLSDETKMLLRSGNVELNRKTMKDISSELLQGVRYPSPHAFRHIWAEAVLTRYQGDIGAVIRHQFCHLDGSFFMAYLRNKDARDLIKGARQCYFNSIVNLLILDSDKVGHEYIGGFARYVKKATELTKVVNESEIKSLRDRINGRIISIQPSHFAICVPRDGGEKRAKCAKFGSINPQDAKPEFCLNCTNAVITSGNIRGIWTTIQPMAKEALNEATMGFMLEAHLPTLRSGYKRIKELQPSSQNKEAVTKILNTIERAISSIESKLKHEELIYG
jgi:hypothetical protein